MKGHRELTPKQKRFIEEYQVDLNSSAAARRAGYSTKTAEWIGPQLLGKSHVSEAIQKALEERRERVQIDADYVLARLKEEGEFTGEGSSHSARVRALELLGKHVGLFPLRGNLSFSLDGQLDVNHATMIEGRRIARRLILEEVREARQLALPESEE